MVSKVWVVFTNTLASFSKTFSPLSCFLVKTLLLLHNGINLCALESIQLYVYYRVSLFWIFPVNRLAMSADDKCRRISYVHVVSLITLRAPGGVASNAAWMINAIFWCPVVYAHLLYAAIRTQTVHAWIKPEEDVLDDDGDIWRRRRMPIRVTHWPRFDLFTPLRCDRQESSIYTPFYLSVHFW